MTNDIIDDLTPFGMEIDCHATLYKNDQKIFRAIKPKSHDFYRKIIRNPTISKLIANKLLIETSESNRKIDGHELVLEHPLISQVSYPFEWPPNMFRDAAIALLRLNIVLMENGYCTHDAHLWNVLFDGITPKFVDFTSISATPPDGRWGAYDQFINCCLSPLLLMQAGQATSARQLMREILSYPDPDLVRKVTSPEIEKLPISKISWQYARAFTRTLARNLPTPLKRQVRSFINSAAKATPARYEAPKGSLRDLQELLRLIESLNISPGNSQWSQYYSGSNELPRYDGQLALLKTITNSTPKHALISGLLERIKPVSVLDLGCNRGLYSQMAALQGAKVVGIDLDERALDDMYLDSKHLGTSAIPLYVNAVAPAEAIGFSEKPFPRVIQRLRSELVLCLALVHHLVFRGSNMSFEHIASLLDSYADKYLLVEFVPIEDKHIASWYTDYYDWYNISNFIESLRQYFEFIEVHESFPSPRKLIFCSKPVTRTTQNNL